MKIKKKIICTLILLILISNIYALDFYNYPNPFKEKTNFKIEFSQNDVKRIELVIYNEDGNRVWEFNKNSDFNMITIIEWYGTDTKGNKLKSDIYIARLNVEYVTGRTEEKMIKVVIIRD